MSIRWRHGGGASARPGGIGWGGWGPCNRVISPNLEDWALEMAELDFSALFSNVEQPGCLLPGLDPLALTDDLCWSRGVEVAAEPGLPAAAAAAAAATAAAAAAAATAAAAAPKSDPELERRRIQNRAAMQRYRQRQRQRRQEQQQQCAELVRGAAVPLFAALNFFAPPFSAQTFLLTPRLVPATRAAPLQASQLERARLEHQAAVSEHKALEAGHSLRDDWLEVLRLLREAQDAEAAAGKGAAPAAAPPGDSDARGGAEASHEALQLADWLEAAAGSGGEAAASGQYVPKLAPALASWLRASPHVLASVRALTPAQLFQYISALWDRVLERVTELLAMVDAAACKQAERQLTDLMVESVRGGVAAGVRLLNGWAGGGGQAPAVLQRVRVPSHKRKARHGRPAERLGWGRGRAADDKGEREQKGVHVAQSEGRWGTGACGRWLSCALLGGRSGSKPGLFVVNRRLPALPPSSPAPTAAGPSPTPNPSPAQCLFLDLVTLLRPNHIKLLMAARSMAPQAAGERGQHADWRDVVAALRLTPAQRRALRGEWQAFQARHSQLASAANAAAAGIATAAAPASQRADDSQHSGLPTSAAAVAAAGTAGLAAGEATAGSMAAHVEPYTRLAESAGELAAAADAHWAALLTFSDEAWYSLTPLQGARLLVACRPFYPDPIQLCMALQEEEAEGAGRGEIGPAQLGGAEAEEAGGGGIEAAAAWGWVRQAAERRDGSGALPAGLPPSSLLG